MRTPPGLLPLIDDGVIDEVLRPLKSGKEASVYLVARGQEICCAKVYKDAGNRGFHQLAAYQEGRKTRSSRDARAMGKRSRHGRREQEAAWKNAEVDALYRLHAAGVRVPRPQGFFDGVLLMEMVADAQGNPAPRLNDVQPTLEEAQQWHAFLMRQIVLMLCAGLIHGDLSEYNVLLGSDGPVIIDLPQVIDAAGNNNAFTMLQRDADNVTGYCGRFAPALLDTRFPHEIWSLYQAGALRPDVQLTGCYVHDQASADVDDVLLHIKEARDEAERRERGRQAADAA